MNINLLNEILMQMILWIYYFNMREFIEIELQMRKERLKFVLWKENILQELWKKREEMYSKIDNKDFVKKQVFKEYTRYVEQFYKDWKNLRYLIDNK